MLPLSIDSFVRVYVHSDQTVRISFSFFAVMTSISLVYLSVRSWIVFSDAFCTGSSLMPQKKNPDVAELTRGKTTIMIAHRLSTLRDADKLIVIEDGKVAEEGTHEELLAKEGGVYNKLYTLQIDALKNAGITE